MRINESHENYLERILLLQREKGYVRSVDIADALEVTKPSVSHAMKLLRENGYILMGQDSLITLTPSGLEVARTMVERHHSLARIFMRMGVPEKTAYEDACKIEHDISEESFEALRRFACEYLQVECKR